MKRAGFVAVVLGTAAVGSLVFATWGAQAHTHTFPSTVTIHQVQPPKQLKVAGKVLAARIGCRHNRDVSVFKRQPGPDPLIGSSNTGSDNKWPPVSVPSKGRYYAHIDPDPRGGGYGHDHTCGGHTSPTVFVSKP